MAKIIKQVQFGELILAFTNQFTFIYNDTKTGSSQDGAFWQPNPPSGFKTLGTYAVGNYSDVNADGNSWALCVAAAPGSNAPLANPTSFTLIWNDHGSGGKYDGSCWRPIAPDGYVALGDVMASGYNPPSTDSVVCVRKDLTKTGMAGAQIWCDQKSGAKMDIDVFLISPNSAVDTNQAKGYFAANTFVANNIYSTPGPASLPEMNLLNLPFPVSITKDPAVPTLESINMPPNISEKTIDRITTIPFTAITDSGRSISWQVNNSPFYFLERAVYYQLELFDYNATTVDQTISKTVAMGVSESQSTTFSVTTGVSVTAEAGVSFIAEGKVSATVSVEMGYETSTNVEAFQEVSVDRQLITPSGKAAAMWSLGYNMNVVRADQTVVGTSLVFDVNSFVQSQYPS
jgi:hypothetical protein